MYQESESVIKAKATDIVKHYYESGIFENGFKAQVVACSRKAAVIYKSALEEALKLYAEKIIEYRNQEKFRQLKVGAVISGGENSPVEWQEFTSESNKKKLIGVAEDDGDFKIEMNFEKEEGLTCFLVVNAMLLTGFDAPIEQVMYLDRVLTNQNLLQAIARVNRTKGEGKTYGLVVDYVGITNNLSKALTYYSNLEESGMLDITKSLVSKEDLKFKLKQAYEDLVTFLKEKNLYDAGDLSAYYDAFSNNEIRDEYLVKFKKFAVIYGELMPDPEVLKYEKDFKDLVKINNEATKYTRDTRFNRTYITAKLKKLVNKYLESEGVELIIEPVSIDSELFIKEQKVLKSDKEKAQSTINALRHTLEIESQIDPEQTVMFSERINQILERYKEDWERIKKEIDKITIEVSNWKNEPVNDDGLNKRNEAPIFNILNKYVTNKPESNTDRAKCLAKTILEKIERNPHFGSDLHSSLNSIRKDVYSDLISNIGLIENDSAIYDKIKNDIIEWVSNNYKNL